MREEANRIESSGPKRRVPLRTLQSEWLFDGEREVLIAHRDQFYRLQVTKAGKLILTK